MADNDSNSLAIPETSDELLTFAEVAARLKISRSTIESAYAGGRLLIPTVRPTAKKTCFRLSDVLRVIRGEVQFCSPAVLTPESRKRLKEREAQRRAAKKAAGKSEEVANA